MVDNIVDARIQIDLLTVKNEKQNQELLRLREERDSLRQELDGVLKMIGEEALQSKEEECEICGRTEKMLNLCWGCGNLRKEEV